MGLQWSSPKQVKNGTLLVTSANFPDGEKASKEVWNLWNAHKTALKKEGFTVGKDTYNGNKWRISYFHEINDNTYEKTTTGKQMWNVDFEKKCRKWHTVLEKNKEQNTFEDDIDAEISGTKTTKKPVTKTTKIQSAKVSQKKYDEDEIDDDFNTMPGSEYQPDEDEDLAELERFLSKTSTN